MKKIKKILIGSIVLIGIISISILIYKKFENNNTILTDAEKFKKEYSGVSDNNVFVYSNIESVIKILENGTGVIYLGFPECQWCQSYVKILNETAKENNIEKIYYVNILEDRKNNTKNYKKLIEILNDNLLYDDEGNHRIYVPDVTIVNKGNIIGHDNESSVITDDTLTPETYWNNERISNLKNKLKESFNKLENNVCTSC